MTLLPDPLALQRTTVGAAPNITDRDPGWIVGVSELTLETFVVRHNVYMYAHAMTNKQPKTKIIEYAERMSL